MFQTLLTLAMSSPRRDDIFCCEKSNRDRSRKHIQQHPNDYSIWTVFGLDCAKIVGWIRMFYQFQGILRAGDFPQLTPGVVFSTNQKVLFNTAETRPGHVFYPSCPRKEKAGLICQYVTMCLEHLWHQQLKSVSNKICFWTSHLGGTFWHALIWTSTSKTNSGNHHICEVCTGL